MAVENLQEYTPLHLIESIDPTETPPKDGRPEIMRKIGAVITGWWLTEAGSGALSHEPIRTTISRDGSVNVQFIQHTRGFSGDEFSIPNADGWTGLEAIKVLNIVHEAASGTINSSYVHPRNFRHILPPHASGRHAASSQETARELWGDRYEA